MAVHKIVIETDFRSSPHNNYMKIIHTKKKEKEKEKKETQEKHYPKKKKKTKHPLITLQLPSGPAAMILFL